MTDVEILKEIKTLSERIGETERKLSMFYDAENSKERENVAGDWNEKETYTQGFYVTYQGDLWLCNIQNKNIRPADNSAYWSKVNIASELNKLASLIKEAKE